MCYGMWRDHSKYWFRQKAAAATPRSKLCFQRPQEDWRADGGTMLALPGSQLSHLGPAHSKKAKSTKQPYWNMAQIKQRKLGAMQQIVLHLPAPPIYYWADLALSWHNVQIVDSIACKSFYSMCIGKSVLW